MTPRQSACSTSTESTSSCTTPRQLAERLEAAVYELATCKPHAPDDRRHYPADWTSYDQGYYWALVMALRCMQLARRSWESMMEVKTEKPRVVPMASARVNGHDVLEQPRAPRPWWEPLTIAAVVIFVVELLIGMAVLIVRAAR